MVRCNTPLTRVTIATTSLHSGVLSLMVKEACVQIRHSGENNEASSAPVTEAWD